MGLLLLALTGLLEDEDEEEGSRLLARRALRLGDADVVATVEAGAAFFGESAFPRLSSASCFLAEDRVVAIEGAEAELVLRDLLVGEEGQEVPLEVLFLFEELATAGSPSDELSESEDEEEEEEDEELLEELEVDFCLALLDWLRRTGGGEASAVLFFESQVDFSGPLLLLFLLAVLLRVTRLSSPASSSASLLLAKDLSELLLEMPVT